MPYGKVVAYRDRNTVTIRIELPDRGEPSERGHADNLVDPRAWIHLEEELDRLAIKMTVCRPYRGRRNWPTNQRRLA